MLLCPRSPRPSQSTDAPNTLLMISQCSQAGKTLLLFSFCSLTGGRRFTYYYRMAISHDDKIFRELFLGLVRLHILHHAARGPVFGLSLIMELERHGYRLSPGTIYPVLHRMEKDGFLFSEKAITAEGKYRRYYRTTKEGDRALSLAQERLRELTEEMDE